MTCNRFSLGAILFCALVCDATLCLAQEVRATLTGTITDSSGSAAPNAQVRLTNHETGTTLTAASNELGQYRLLFINAGSYRLTVEAPGFRTSVRDDVV